MDLSLKSLSTLQLLTVMKPDTEHNGSRHPAAVGVFVHCLTCNRGYCP